MLHTRCNNHDPASNRWPTMWIVVGAVLFTVSWSLTGGGYLCSVPLSILILLYVAMNTTFKGTNLAKIPPVMKFNVFRILYEERYSIILLMLYWSFEIVVTIWFPSVEQSNGSPFSLIFFSITFVVIFIVPTIFWLIAFPYSKLVNWEKGLHYGEKSKTCFIDMARIVWSQRIIIFVVISFVFVTFLVDADVTFIIRYTMHGKPCWPVLISQSSISTMPYPLQYSWINSWNKIFKGYSPGRIQRFILVFGRSLGEVPTILPTVIGVYMVSLLIISSRHRILRQTLFSCIAGIVLGGVFSGTLKILIHRYRPNAYGNPYKWIGPSTVVVNHLAFSKLDLSFPAGHTSVTCAVSTCIYQSWLAHQSSQGMLRRVCVIFFLYIFPFIVLVSRVGDCYHWNSDAAFGMLLGFLVGLTVSKMMYQELEVSELPL